METINQLLDEKGHHVYAIAPDSPVYGAIEMMAQRGVGALLVMEDDALVGVVSERDYARKVILKGKSSRATQVRDIMTTRVVWVSPHDTVEQCLSLMTEEKIRHLPVVDEGKVMGVLSIGDLVKSVISDQKHLIESLEQYISG